MLFLYWYLCVCVCVCQVHGTAPQKWQWRPWSLVPCPPSLSWKRLRSWRNFAMTSWCSSTLWCLRSPFTLSLSIWAKVRMHVHILAVYVLFFFLHHIMNDARSDKSNFQCLIYWLVREHRNALWDTLALTYQSCVETCADLSEGVVVRKDSCDSGKFRI